MVYGVETEILLAESIKDIMKAEEFIKIVEDMDDKCSEYYGIFPSPTDAQFGLDILIKHFLGDNWYCISTNTMQRNTEAIYDILKKYPKKKSIREILKSLFTRRTK